ncbi:MAG: Crp/Fnr family transcriptional regulator [Campylobacteraceae bacterium]|nr:Crp/Fnr family transcriptional regulator [Campylobacteraceae bacterium]
MFKELKDIKIFQKLGQEDISELAQISKMKKFNAGEIVNYENDNIEKVYFLLEGFIKIYKINRFDNEVFLYTVKGSELITTFNFSGTSVYFSNTECMEDSLILCINLEPLQELIKKSHAVSVFFYEEMSKKVEVLKYVISREMVYDGTAKVAYMLINFIDEFNALRKQDVAYMLNIQPETLSRILTKLKRENIIETSADGDVIIKKHDKLTAIFT